MPYYLKNKNPSIKCGFTKIQLGDPSKLEMRKTHKLLKSLLRTGMSSLNLSIWSHQQILHVATVFHLHYTERYFFPSCKPSNPLLIYSQFHLELSQCLSVSKTACKLLQIPSAPRNTAMNTKYKAESWSIWTVTPKYTHQVLGYFLLLPSVVPRANFSSFSLGLGLSKVRFVHTALVTISHSPPAWEFLDSETTSTVRICSNMQVPRFSLFIDQALM